MILCSPRQNQASKSSCLWTTNFLFIKYPPGCAQHVELILYTALHGRICSQKKLCFSYFTLFLKSHGLHELVSSTSSACVCKWDFLEQLPSTTAHLQLQQASLQQITAFPISKASWTESSSSVTVVEPFGSQAVPGSAGSCTPGQPEPSSALRRSPSGAMCVWAGSELARGERIYSFAWLLLCFF